MARRTLNEKRVIITGASSGIGRELARQLAACGARLVLAARREERLNQLTEELRATGTDVHFVAGDICSSEYRDELLQLAQQQLGGVDLLINNAGIGALGPFDEADEQRLRQVMEVNFFAPAELIRVALPALRDGTQSMIVNVGSVLGHRAVPSKSEYCASKFAIHGFSDALRAELARDGIDVLLVSPSTTRSEFFDQVIAGDGTSQAGRGMPPEVVAAKAIRAIQRGKHEIILSWGGWFLVWLDRLAPGLANRMVARFTK